MARAYFTLLLLLSAIAVFVGATFSKQANYAVRSHLPNCMERDERFVSQGRVAVFDWSIAYQEFKWFQRELDFLKSASTSRGGDSGADAPAVRHLSMVVDVPRLQKRLQELTDGEHSIPADNHKVAFIRYEGVIYAMAYQRMLHEIERFAERHSIALVLRYPQPPERIGSNPNVSMVFLFSGNTELHDNTRILETHGGMDITSDIVALLNKKYPAGEIALPQLPNTGQESLEE